MARKSKKQITSNFMKYLRELSIVITGVFITLVITNIISAKGKRDEVERAVALIKTELENNLYQLEWAQQKWETEQKAFHLIKQHIDNLNKIPADTLIKYRKIIGDKHSLSASSDSYEVIKSSLLMQYIQDKDFLSDLSKTYGNIELINNKLLHYTNTKGTGLDHMINHTDKTHLEKWVNGSIYDFYAIPLNDNVFRIFVYTGNTLISSDEFEACKNGIRSVINKMDQQ